MKMEELNNILEKHKLWFKNDPEGIYADLRGANLMNADLRGADLHGANLYGANLMNADLAYFGTNFKIKKVIFNDPATIVFWSDGSKTVVKAQDGDVFDFEKGLAMAISKKALGNKGNYCNELKKWLPNDEDKNERKDS